MSEIKPTTSVDPTPGAPGGAFTPRPNVPLTARALPEEAWSEGVRFGTREIALGKMGGAQKVGVRLERIPPGKQSCPFHYHLREEEHFYVLEGQCVLRSGDQRFVMKAGDYVCFPAGTGVAHAFENPFDAECVFLGIGTRDESDIAVYPDSRKAMVRAIKAIVPWPIKSVDYWEGERPDEPLG